jgi:hypothetical protein
MRPRRVVGHHEAEMHMAVTSAMQIFEVLQ